MNGLKTLKDFPYELIQLGETINQQIDQADSDDQIDALVEQMEDAAYNHGFLGQGCYLLELLREEE